MAFSGSKNISYIREFNLSMKGLHKISSMGLEVTSINEDSTSSVGICLYSIWLLYGIGDIFFDMLILAP